MTSINTRNKFNEAKKKVERTNQEWYNPNNAEKTLQFKCIIQKQPPEVFC